MTTKSKRKVRTDADGSVDAIEFLEAKHGKLTLGRLIRAIRQADELSLAEFSEKLGISRGHLSDIEKERKFINPGRAAEYARLIGHAPNMFVQLSLEGLLEREGVEGTVQVKLAS